MQAKRNKALLFLGLLVVSLIFLFGHVFPALEAFKNNQDDLLDSLREPPENMIQVDPFLTRI